MKLWINFEEKDIKKRINGWREGDDFEGQLIFEEKQDRDLCDISFNKEYQENEVVIHFDNGNLSMTRKEFGELFQ